VELHRRGLVGNQRALTLSRRPANGTQTLRCSLGAFFLGRRVVFDNESDPASTLITVDSANKAGCLLQVVQLLTDLDLVISKAHISSDGGWFVDGTLPPPPPSFLAP